MASFATVGYDTPFLPQGEILSTSTGDGTPYPVIWRKDIGDASANQIVPFLWQVSTISFDISGTVTLTFVDPAGVAPSEQHTFSYTVSSLYARFNIPTTGDATQLKVGGSIYPNLVTANGGDEVDNSTLISGSGSVTPSSIVTGWGETVSAIVGAGFSMQQDLIPIQGTRVVGLPSWTQYTRGLKIAMNASVSDLGGFVSLTTDQSIGSWTALGTSASIFHGTAALYLNNSGGYSGDTITVSSSTVAVSTTLPPGTI